MGTDGNQLRARSRKTRRSVLLADMAARLLITLGGTGTILAVSLVCVFLAWVTVPLFRGAAVTSAGQFAPAHHDASARGPQPIHLAIDEHQVIAWELFDDGTLVSFRADSGEELERRALFDGSTLSAVGFAQRDADVVFGFADGTGRLGRIEVETRFLPPEEVAGPLDNLAVGQRASYGAGVVERTPEGQFRQQRVSVTLEEPFTLSAGVPIALLDMSTRPTGPMIAALTADGTLHLKGVSRRRNLLTGEETVTLSGGELTRAVEAGAEPPARLLLAGLGDTVYLAWPDGRIQRFDTRDPRQPALAETIAAVEPGADRHLTALGFLIGKATLITGDSTGQLRAWFRTRPEQPDTPDGAVVVVAHELSGDGAAATALAASARKRMLAVGYADGTVRLFHVTARRLLVTIPPPEPGPVRALALAPKDDGLLVANDHGLRRWALDAPHPEVTLGVLFRPVWYEGQTEPIHSWQSSGGTDDFEPKFGMLPLVFGTLKATVYSLLFGVPLALLAAVYTSEFLSPRVRARIKPTIELMASLPSVVLGFLAALVIAPFAAGCVPAILTGLAAVPFVILLAAHVWQMLPRPAALHLAWAQFPLLILCVPAGVALAALLGPLVEQALFAGDIMAWLDGQVGTGIGGWLMMMLPISAVGVTLMIAWGLRPWMRRHLSAWSEGRMALLSLALFLTGSAAAVALALGISGLLHALGQDPRGSYVGTYMQRNSMVVGFVMGFAIIPIIYTIAEDALTAVPDHLRSASLGAGATQWQTAVRVIIPTALSGLFSAVMIGFGRAIGETMIVLMATGNTPVMEWNIFNGFRTLSANIAVELPEAVRNDTHYRLLFLSALTLFLITFAVNTVAELVRQRFRKRAFQL
jgi:phosphate transport system permease protein